VWPRKETFASSPHPFKMEVDFLPSLFFPPGELSAAPPLSSHSIKDVIFFPFFIFLSSVVVVSLSLFSDHDGLLGALLSFLSPGSPAAPIGRHPFPSGQIHAYSSSSFFFFFPHLVGSCSFFPFPMRD